MKLNRDTKFGEESTFHFKIGIMNLTKFDSSTRIDSQFLKPLKPMKNDKSPGNDDLTKEFYETL